MTSTQPDRQSPLSAEREASLLLEIADLSAALDAIRTGGIDAVMIPSPEGERLYTLTSTDRPYRAIVEEMGEGAATITAGGLVLYSNGRFAELAGRDRKSLLGMALADLVKARPEVLSALVATPAGATDFAEMELLRPNGSTVQVLASVTGLDLDGVVIRCLVVADLSRRVEAEEQLLAMMENALTGMAVMSPGGRFALVNPAMCQILGRDAERLLTMTWPDLTHPDDVERDRVLVEQLAAGRIPSFRVRKRYLRPDGTVVWADLSATCLHRDDRSVKYFIAQVVDVTEVVLAERELIRREAELQTIAAGSADILVRTTPDGRIEYVSPAITRILGWSPDEIVGRDTAELIHPEDRAAGLSLHESGQVLPSRARLRGKDGSYRWMGTTATSLGTAGNPTGVIAVVRDIEDLVEAERALAESERHYRWLVEGAAEALFESGPDRRVIWVSPAITAILGWTPDELVGTEMFDLLEPEDREKISSECARLSAGQATAERDHVVRIQTKSGEYRWVSIWGAPVVDKSGALVQTVGGIQDIHELVSARERLRATLDTEMDPHVVLEAVRDQAGRIVDYVYADATPAACEYMGISLDDLIGTRLFDLVPGQRETELVEMYRTVVETGAPFRIDGFVYKSEIKGGKDVSYDIQLAKVGDGLAYTWRDVSDRAASADALARSEARLRATLDTEFDPHVVFKSVRDEAGQIVDFGYVEANPAACDYNAMSYDDLIGARLLELLPAALHAEIMGMYRPVVETGVPLRVDGFAYANPLTGGATQLFDIQAAKVDDGLSCTWRDVTDRVATANALAQSEEIHRLLTENLSDVVVHLRDGIVAWVSPSLTATLGWSPEDWLGQRIVDYVDPNGLGDVDEPRAALYRGEIELFRVRVRAQDGLYHWVQVHAKPFLNDGERDGIVASFRSIDAEVAAEDDLKVRARSDELTGLLNRREVLERVSALTSHPRRTGEESAVLFGDIDGFKTINDEFGHSAGDDVLQAVATRINACLRTGDVAARIGGDEILILLDGVHELANAVDVADNIRRAVAEPIRTDGRTVSATMSIGVTLAVPGEDVDDMIARADQAMYEAKQAGGDRVVPRMPTSA